MPKWTWVLPGVLGLCAVAALWWAIRSGESAAWAIFFSLASMVISVSGWAARRRDKRPSPGPTERR